MTTDPDVLRHLAAIHIRGGSPPDLRQRDRALEWLLGHADRVWPIALAQAEAAPLDVVLVDLIGRIRRPEATAFLERAFDDERTRVTAASGLGMSPDPAAGAVLRRALASPDPRRIVAALSGLAAGGDPARCADVRPHVTSADAEVRWMAAEAARRLGCDGGNGGRGRIED